MFFLLVITPLNNLNVVLNRVESSSVVVVVLETLFGDFAHTLQHRNWQSIHDLQSIATAGKLGKSAGKPKPFDNLKIAQIKELYAQGEYDTNKKKGNSAKPTR